MRLLNLTFLCFALSSCSSKSQTAQIKQTTIEAIDAIQKLNTSRFISLTGRRSLNEISKTEEMVGLDIISFKQLFESNFGSEIPLFIITETYNSLGQRRVMIPIFNKSKAGVVNSLHLNLLIGPPDFFSLDKLQDMR
jgi:hypothetical protein